jgi:tryptophanase
MNINAANINTVTRQLQALMDSLSDQGIPIRDQIAGTGVFLAALGQAPRLAVKLCEQRARDATAEEILD